jgi:hypothetical protein
VLERMDFRALRDDMDSRPWEKEEPTTKHLQAINLAPLKGALESDPVRSKVLRVLIEDGAWVTTADLLRAARQVRSIVGAVTIGTILNSMNDLVSSRLVLSRTSLSAGLEWAEWRINPDWLEPTRKLLQMLNRKRIRTPPKKQVEKKSGRLLEELKQTTLLDIE